MSYGRVAAFQCSIPVPWMPMRILERCPWAVHSFFVPAGGKLRSPPYRRTFICRPTPIHSPSFVFILRGLRHLPARKDKSTME